METARRADGSLLHTADHDYSLATAGLHSGGLIVVGLPFPQDIAAINQQLHSAAIELTIADTGSGLTDEMRERLFLPYFSTKQRGTGLGLAIAAKIVQEHGGSIRAEKNQPVGARFIVELRSTVAAELDALPEADKTPELRNGVPA